VHADGGHEFVLPQEIGCGKYGAIGAGEAVGPIVAGHRGFGGVGFFYFDAAALAGSHAAGHGALDGDLAVEMVRGGDLGDALHHGFGAAGVEGEVF
jgi:hypothetical protein